MKYRDWALVVVFLADVTGGEGEVGRCDAEGHPAYLEATSERNRALYERLGFRVTSRIDLSGGPPMWSMWREPQA